MKAIPLFKTKLQQNSFEAKKQILLTGLLVKSVGLAWKKCANIPDKGWTQPLL
jgi:hypothetical protein